MSMKWKYHLPMGAGPDKSTSGNYMISHWRFYTGCENHVLSCRTGVDNVTLGNYTTAYGARSAAAKHKQLMTSGKKAEPHADTVRIDWLEDHHHEYDPFLTADGQHGVYFHGTVITRQSTFRKAVDAAIKHQQQRKGSNK